MNQTAEQQTTDDKLVIPVTNGCRPINDMAMAQYSVDELNESNGNGNKRDTRFQKGNKLGGRTKGTRNKLSEQFLQDMHDCWMLATTHNIDGEPVESTVGRDVCLKVAVGAPEKMLAAMVQVLPKDFQVSVDVDQVQWVINASPRLTEDEWRQQHNLIESDPTETA